MAQYFVTGKGKIPPASSGYNISGRAYPDIAAQASRTITHRRLVHARALLVVPPAAPVTAGAVPPTSASPLVSVASYTCRYMLTCALQFDGIIQQATDFTVVANRIPNPGVAGTSCATPTASGVIALLNDALLQAGKPVLG